MHDDVLPLATNPTETFPEHGGIDVEHVGTYDPLLGAMTLALMVAQSGILSVDDVAAVLRCSVDTVRRIPVGELPSYDGPGRGILYRMDEVQNYLRGQKRHQRRRSGLGQPADIRPDPNPVGRNPTADALKKFSTGVAA